MTVVDDGELFASLYPSLRRFASAVAPPGVHPDDLVQDALARRLTIGPLSALDDAAPYLRRAILNLASNRRRSSRRAQRAIARLSLAEGSSVAYPSDLGDLAALEPRQRAVLYLHHVEGWSFADVAVQLDCTQEAARQLASRGRRVLADRLRAEEEG